MQLLIDGQLQQLIDLREFRGCYALPDSFSVGYFEPKDYSGLGSIEQAGAELTQLRTKVLARLPRQLSLMDWLKAASDIQQFFWQELVYINGAVGLRDPEIDFAAAGFGDVCRAVIYALIRARSERRDPPSFDAIYADWLASTVKVAARVHEYPHGGAVWRVRIISHAYGRMGLLVESDAECWYVYDHRLACPAEGYMVHFLREVAAHIVVNSV